MFMCNIYKIIITTRIPDRFICLKNEDGTLLRLNKRKSKIVKKIYGRQRRGSTEGRSSEKPCHQEFQSIRLFSGPWNKVHRKPRHSDPVPDSKT